MALCEGCQEFRHRLFQPSQEFPEEEVTISLHKSFAELSECADSRCDLCMYVRREIYFQPDRTCTNYLFCDEDFEDQDREIMLSLRCSKYDITSKEWKFNYEGFLRMGLENRRWRSCYHPDTGTDDKLRAQVTGLEQLVDMSRRWLVTCQNEHERCRSQATQNLGFLPTRLLDVGSPGDHTVRLVSCENLSEARSTTYLTLSYCWGEGNDAACTTRANMDDRLKGLPVSSLPQTIQDAIVLTRAFSVKYLWVDALCIIQGGADNEDWRRELPNMGKIYRHSLFTIAASSAADSSIGFLRRRIGTQWPVRDYRLSCDDDPGIEGDNILLKATLPWWGIAVESSVLFKRGWVLQERMLASRTLFWTEIGVFWECNELRGSEYKDKYDEYEGSPTHLQLSELVKDIEDHEFLIKKREFEETPLCSKGSWSILLEDFSAKTLTHMIDKLPAITGLGQELARLTGSEFEMGVFKHNLVQELAWVTGFKQEYIGITVVTAEQQTVRVSGTPSWCWASAHRPLLFRPTEGRSLSQELAMNIDLNKQRIYARSRLGSLRVRALDGQSITLMGSYGYITLPVSPHTFKPCRSCVNVPVEFAGNVYDEVAIFDTSSEALSEEGGTITCVQWLNWEAVMEWESETLRRVTVTGALIVAPTGEGSNVYRRIGWLEVFDADFFDKEPQDIVLV